MNSDRDTEISLDRRNREFLERVIDERDRNYTERIKAVDKLIEDRFRAIEKLIDERDRLYDARFRASDIAVSAALTAQEKSVNAAFAASEKAIVKAEQAQKEYNERSNEFRGQLDDQAKTLMPRPETLNMFKALEEKLSGVQNVMDSRLAALQEASKSDLEAVKVQVAGLRESRSEGGGKDLAQRGYRAQQQWNIGTVIAIFFGVLTFLASVIGIGLHFVK